MFDNVAFEVVIGLVFIYLHYILLVRFEPLSGRALPNLNLTTNPARSPVIVMKARGKNRTTGEAAKEKIYRPGSIINDALLQSCEPSEVEQEDFINLMKSYFGQGAAMSDVLDFLKANRFLRTIINAAYTTHLKNEKTETVAQSGIGNFFSNLSLSSIGGLDVTSFAYGAAKFLVRREKQDSIGIPKTPLSFCAGVRAVAALRKVSAGSNDFSRKIHLRFSTPLAVDVPLLNFHSWSK